MTRRRKLTEQQVLAIRAQHVPRKHGSGYGAMAAKYGVAPSTIRDIVQLATYIDLIKKQSPAALTAGPLPKPHI